MLAPGGSPHSLPLLVSKTHPSAVKNKTHFSALHENHVGERPASAEANVQRVRHYNVTNSFSVFNFDCQQKGRDSNSILFCILISGFFGGGGIQLFWVSPVGQQ